MTPSDARPGCPTETFAQRAGVRTGYQNAHVNQRLCESCGGPFFCNPYQQNPPVRCLDCRRNFAPAPHPNSPALGLRPESSPPPTAPASSSAPAAGGGTPVVAGAEDYSPKTDGDRWHAGLRAHHLAPRAAEQAAPPGFSPIRCATCKTNCGPLYEGSDGSDYCAEHLVAPSALIECAECCKPATLHCEDGCADIRDLCVECARGHRHVPFGDQDEPEERRECADCSDLAAEGFAYCWRHVGHRRLRVCPECDCPAHDGPCKRSVDVDPIPSRAEMLEAALRNRDPRTLAAEIVTQAISHEFRASDMIRLRNEAVSLIDLVLRDVYDSAAITAADLRHSADALNRGFEAWRETLPRTKVAITPRLAAGLAAAQDGE